MFNVSETSENLFTWEIWGKPNLVDPKQFDFHGFPKHCGWRLKEVGEFLRLESDEEKEPILMCFGEFMETWLFFGLLATLLRGSRANPVGIDLRHFVSRGKYLTTRGLKLWLEKWENWELENKNGITLRMIRAQTVLDKARRVVLGYSSSYKDRTDLSIQPDGTGPGQANRLNPKLILWLMVLGESLTLAKARIEERVRMTCAIQPPAGWSSGVSQGWGTPEIIISVMIKDNWCPCTVEMLRGLLKGNASALLAVYMTLRDSGSDHHKHVGKYPCDNDTCQAKWEDPDCNSYKPRHCCESRNCELKGPEMEQVKSIIEDGDIPLIRMETNDSDVRLLVEKWVPGLEFATFSHVWSDGYGNEEGNQLPVCLLRFLGSLLSKAVSAQTHGPEVPADLPPFWIDTLIIPEGQEYESVRPKAVQQIHSVYTKAKYSIVIDNGLMSMNHGNEYKAIAMKMLASGWMRRLWTLQEAFLSKKLFVKFEERNMVNLDVLEDTHGLSNTDFSSNVADAARNYFHNILGLPRRHRAVNLEQEGVALVANVWRATQWRTTTHLHHETMALATLLDVDYKYTSFANIGKAGRGSNQTPHLLDRMMRDLWIELDDQRPGVIPPGIIFAPGEKLDEPGFGWAPRTWMARQETDFPDPLSFASTTARLDKVKGLFVEFPGIRLHAMESTLNNILLDFARSPFIPFIFPTDLSLSEWYEVQKAELEESEDLISTPRPLAIILLRPRPSSIPEIGLLVEINQEKPLTKTKCKTAAFHVRILCRVRVRRCRDAHSWTRDPESVSSGGHQSPEGFTANNDTYVDRDDAIFGETLDVEQVWCVGGPTLDAEKTPAPNAEVTPVPNAAEAATDAQDTPTAGAPSLSKPKRPSFVKRMWGELKSSP